MFSRRLHVGIALSTIALLGVPAAHAQFWRNDPVMHTDLVFSGGIGEVFRNEGKRPGLFSVELRFKESWSTIHPYVIFAQATDSATYVGAGLFKTIALSPRWWITVSSGPGFYSRNRSVKDLGSSMEFFSNFEVSRKVSRHGRLGVSIGHISNGSIGNRNPGSETLRLSYSYALR